MAILIDRKQQIKDKGFSMNLENSTEDVYGTNFRNIDFSKIKVGIKSLDDAVVTLGDYKKANSRLADKETILQAINNADYETMREASNFFYRISGIYSRLCRYMAYLYRYDWMITPYIAGDNLKNGEKALADFNKVLLVKKDADFCKSASKNQI